MLAIVTIVSSQAIPSTYHLIERNKSAHGINWIVRAINMTRFSAVTFSTLTTLCPTRNDIDCGGEWNNRVMIFTDQNNNRALDAADRIISYLDFPYEGSTLKWRSFKNRQYLQMTAMGFTNYQNGNFVYCSRDQNPAHARQVVLNLQGRVKKAFDRNGDGIIEDQYNKPLRC